MDAAARKFLFLVSDRSGATASHLLTASFYQFGQQGDDITVQVFSNVRTSRMLSRIVCLAQRINALVCFTLADRNARRMLVHHCEELGVEQLDLLGELSDQLGSFLGADLAAAQSPSKSKCATPESVTPAARKRVLSPGYFERCAAVDFAIKMNDGVNLQHLIEADIVLLGLSRCQKTPLSIYLAHQFALKVGNVPLELGCALPDEVFGVDPRRVFVLLAQPDFLVRTRRRRLEVAGSTGESVRMPPGRFSSEYASPAYVEEELAWVRALSARHPQFRCIDVTGIGVEEVAHDHVMTTLPRRPTPVEVALEALGCNFLLASAGGADDDLLARVRYCSDGLCLLAGRAREQIVGQPLEALLEAMQGTSGGAAGAEAARTAAEILDMVATGTEGKVAMMCAAAQEGGEGYENEVHMNPIGEAGAPSDGASSDGSGAWKRMTIISMHPLRAQGGAGGAQGETGDEDKASERARHKTFYTVLDARGDGLPLRYASRGFFKLTAFSRQDVYGEGGAEAGEGESRRAFLWAPRRHFPDRARAAIGLGRGTGRMGEVGGGRGESGNPHLLHSLPREELEEVQSRVAAGLPVTTCFSATRSRSLANGLPLWIYARLEPVAEPGTNSPLLYVGIHHAVS